MIKTAKMQGNMMVSARGGGWGGGGRRTWVRNVMCVRGVLSSQSRPFGSYPARPHAARSGAFFTSHPNRPLAVGCRGSDVLLRIATLRLRGSSALGL